MRSELLLGGRPIGDVSEQIQVDAYRAVLEHAGDREVTIRTFDITPEELGAPELLEVEPRERLGMRGLRLGLARPELLERQLRALVRAGQGRNLRVMFPFVTSADEVSRATAMLGRKPRGSAFRPHRPARWSKCRPRPSMPAAWRGMRRSSASGPTT